MFKIKEDGGEEQANISYVGSYPVVYNHGHACVHKLLAEAFIPNPLGKTQVNHIDGNKRNNSLENLEWATQSENTSHAYKTGLSKGRKGIKNMDYSCAKSPLLRNIHKKCVENGISFCGLEKAVGIGNGVIAGWDKSNPRVDTLQKVANYFGVTLDELTKEKDK